MKSKIGREITCQEAVKRYYIFQIMMQNIRILYLSNRYSKQSRYSQFFLYSE